MRIYLRTEISNSLDKIHPKFNEDLFKKLAPPLMNLSVERFDGCLKGHEVHLAMNFQGMMNQKWISVITTSEYNADTFYFIDEGTLLPPPLKSWKHIHRVDRINDNSCWVIDDIEFSSGSKILDKLLYPFLFGMFKLRGPIYQRELT